MKKLTLLILGVVFLSTINVFSQNDKSYFKEYEPGYYQNFILKMTLVH